MSSIILDRELRARLNGLNEQLEIRDEQGVLVGHYLPAKDYLVLLYELERSRPPAAVELEVARASYRIRGGKTTAEAVAYLEALDRGEQSA